MLHLESLELEGFKSFSDKTKLKFQEGITCIVGPNGCGKSNISDAVSWVLGEQSAKSLRGEKMEDVIFAGSPSKKANNFAEVSMTWVKLEALQAEDQDNRLVITRRLLRNGDSFYLMNGKQCRLKDIQTALLELGMGTKAYSIIEQGKVGLILSSKPSERRQLIEEAAGILKYKLRRHETQLKLRAAEENLIRINDIIAEVQKQRTHLGRQVGKARRYKLLKDELRSKESGCLLFDLYHTAMELASVRQTYEKVAAREATLTKSMLAKENEITVAKGQTQREEQLLRGLEKLQATLHTKLEVTEREILHLGEMREERKIQLIQAHKDRESALAEQARLEETHANREDDLARLEEELAEKSALVLATRAMAETLKEEANQALNRSAGFRDSFQNLKAKIHGLDVAYQQVANQVHGIQEQLQQYLESARNLSEELGRHQEEQETLGQTKEQQVVLIETLADHHADLEGRHATTQKEVERLSEEIRQKERELRALEDRQRNLEEILQSKMGVSDALKSILQKEKFQILRDVIDSNHEYDQALEFILEPIIEAILIHDDTEYTRLTPFLEQVTLKYLDLRKPAHKDENEPHVEGLVPAGDLLRTDTRVLTALRPSLARKFIVADPTRLESLASNYPDFQLVTQDGRRWIQGALRFVLGKNRKTTGFLQMKGEISKLESQQDDIRKQMDKLLPIREQQSQHLATLKDQVMIARNKLTDAERKLVVHEQQTVNLERLIQQLEKRQAHEATSATQLETRKKELLQQQKHIKEEGEQTQAQLAEVELNLAEAQEAVDLVQAKQHQIQGELGKAQQQEVSVREMSKRIRDERDRLSGQRRSIKERLEKVDRQEKQWQSDLSHFETQEKENQVLLKNMQAERSAKQVELEKQDLKLNDAKERVATLEAQLKQFNGERDDIRAELGRYELSRARLTGELNHFSETFLEQNEKEFELKEVDPFTLPAKEIYDQDKKEISELKRKINELGTVNLLAIEEYEEIDARYNFLTSQQKDLIEAIAEIRTTIEKLNKTSAERFREAFDVINDGFDTMFQALFGGGQARLELLEPDNILDSGIDMIIQPPGKKLQNAMLMSGGEKALTAVALLFAIFEYRPSPFCLLDEVDAPLDEANVRRLARKIEEMRSQTQFIIITHHKTTMQIAGSLFGVTMENSGCSKIVSVKFS